MQTIQQALTIAGSDSGGGAGIQADLKTFAALGVYGLSVITAVTAQNTLGVQAVYALPADFVAHQIDSVLDDFNPTAIKIGMLANTSIIQAVAACLEKYKSRRPGWIQVVTDPVMLSSTGSSLLESEARQAFRDLILPLSDVITPNLNEAHALIGIDAQTPAEMRLAAQALLALGVRSAIVKGGHLPDGQDCADILLNEGKWYEFSTPRIPTRNDHGTGCTFSAAIAAGLARGFSLPGAVAWAKQYITAILQGSASSRLGQGRGPLLHTEMTTLKT